MNVKNTGSKIVSIGTLVLLPGDTVELDASIEANSNVDTLVEMGFLTRLGRRKNAENDEAKAEAAAKKAAEDAEKKAAADAKKAAEAAAKKADEEQKNGQ